MRHRYVVQFLIAVLAWSWPPVTARTADGAQVPSAASSYGVSELIAAAKRSDPELAGVLEHLLAGVQLGTDAAATLRDLYPGFLAATAIGQLIDRHGRDIANMTYREREHFIGGEFGDPSLIPNTAPAVIDTSIDTFCRKMLVDDFGAISDCRKYVGRIRSCRNEHLSTAQKRHCDEDLTAFYDHMELHGKNTLVREAGRIAGLGFTVGNKVKGAWNNTTHTHVGCDAKRVNTSVCKSYRINLMFSTEDGYIKATWPVGYSIKGLITEGTTFEFTMYLNGSKHATGSFTFEGDYTSFSGSWVDLFGHKGTWHGTRSSGAR